MEPSGVDLPSFPAPRTDPLGVADELLRLREREPVARVRLPDGSEAWLVTSPGVGRQVLGNRRFSSDATRPGFPQTSTLRRDAPLGRTLIRIDPPEHTRLRRLLNPDFVVSRVEALRPGVARIAGALLDEVVSEGPPADLVEAFARPLPALVIAEVLGVPDAERRHFEDLSRRLVTSADGPDRAIQAMEGLRDYMERLVTARRATPGEDVLSRLVELEEAGELDHDQAVDTGRLLLLAGHVTTANMIALGVLMLLRHPAQLAAVRGDPTLMRAGVEELLRHQTLIQGGLRRVATEDVELGGRRIRAGDGVVVAIAAANRDPALGGDCFDVHRGTRNHLAFGYGFHQCLGQHLARVELDVALTAVSTRLPTLAVAVPEADISFREDGFLHGLRALPVTW
ncbi:MAG TPA: cytochrome P450 [Candidatus Dormibacteraeota bacterium]|nr:cytochrome P450 [Candidatus Dormibacteraeota bacterium]